MVRPFPGAEGRIPLLEYLTKEGRGAVPIVALDKDTLSAWLAGQSKRVKAWVRNVRFAAKSGSVCAVPATDGRLAVVLAGVGSSAADGSRLWGWAALPAALPAGRYRIEPEPPQEDASRAALGWALGTYGFHRYKKRETSFATLVWPRHSDRQAVEAAAEATFWARDLINTPAEDMGPEELAAAARELAQAHGAKVRVTVGDDLIKANYPAVHAVGRASARAPRLIDLTWGKPGAPKLTLVGKGVCFDSGGLDLKSAAGMKLMKKDMGGAAQVLGLARMVMAAGLKVRLRVLVPAVENSVSGNAIRPLDVIRTRKGLTVEIGNTDAEGRVILADALAEAASESPQLIVDCATLTGAARVALGTELPAVFCNQDRLADSLLASGEREADPVWRMPLWEPYARHIDSKVADINNAVEGGYGGAITAALFLKRFVEGPDGAAVPWIHLDFMGWNLSGRPGRPEGGEVMGMRALFGLVRDRFGG